MMLYVFCSVSLAATYGGLDLYPIGYESSPDTHSDPEANIEWIRDLRCVSNDGKKVLEAALTSDEALKSPCAAIPIEFADGNYYISNISPTSLVEGHIYAENLLN